jgi:hypothetical protein
MLPPDMKMGGNVFLASLGLITIAACSSGSNSLKADSGTAAIGCNPPATVEDQGLQTCSGCTSSTTCTSQAPLEACCTWATQPNAALARSSNLHRYAGSGPVDLSCLASPAMPGTSKMVTLTGYVRVFSSGTDSAGVLVQVFKENTPKTPDGSFDAANPVGSYKTSMTDAVDPIDTTWNTHGCPNGCSYRQYKIANVPTETPLVIETSDASGSGAWGTIYDYNIYFSNGSLAAIDGGAPGAQYDATAVAADDPGVVAGSVGQTPDGTKGMLAGEVHDCGDVRLAGATVGTTVPPQGPLYYSTSDEGNPLLDATAHATSELSLFAGMNFPTGKPIRVTAFGEDPANAGKFLMLGTYVVQTYPGAVTALSFRGRRPWQP